MAGPYPVDGDQYRTIDRKMIELKRQLNAKSGSPIDPDWLERQLQALIEQKPVVSREAEDVTNILDLEIYWAYSNSLFAEVTYSSTASEALKNNYCERIRDLAYYTDKELMRLPGVGKVTVIFAHAVCKAAGFELGELARVVERTAEGVPVPIALNRVQQSIDYRWGDPETVLLMVDLGGNAEAIYRSVPKWDGRSWFHLLNSHSTTILEERIAKYFASHGLAWPCASHSDGENSVT